MTRSVRQLNVDIRRPEDATPRPFSDFAAVPNLVLLGDPGAGKTYLLHEVAKAEGARFLKARSFLSTPAQSLSGQALFIDALDEQRAGRADQNTIDEIVRKLFEVNPSKVWISCRVADWLGKSDLAGLGPYFEQYGEPPVLLLETLSASEQLDVLASQGVDWVAAAAFLSEASERGPRF